MTDLSTGDFVSGIAGLIVGLVIGLLLGLPLTHLPDPYRWLLPIGTVLVTGLGMMGLTVAKRADLADALRNAGVLRAPTGDRPPGRRVSRARRHTSTPAP